MMLRRLASEAGAGSVSLEAMIERAETDRQFYDELFHVLSIDAERAMRELLRTAAATGSITADQRVVMGLFAGRLGMSDQRYDRLVSAVEKQLQRRRGGEAASPGDPVLDENAGMR